MFTEQQIKEYRSNFPLVAENHFYIQNKDAEMVKFKFNRLQRYLWFLLLEDLKNGTPVRWMIIKSRQLGCSTWILALFYWVMMFYPNRRALVVAHEDEASMELGEKPKFIHNNLPPELKPLEKTNNRHQLYLSNPNTDGELGLESKMVVKTAGASSLAASYTLHLALFSELALWEAEHGIDIKKQLGTALQTIPKKPGTIVIIETTARGEGKCKEMWDDSDNSYQKIFISWIADEGYRLNIELDKYFELVDDDSHKYGDETEVAKLIETELYKWYPEIIQLNEPLRSQTIQHEIMCRLAWRRSIINDECQGDKQLFEREYPLTAEQAFTGTGKNVFSQNRLKDIKNYLEENKPEFKRYRFDAVEKKFELSRYGPLKVYIPPVKGFKYVLAADPAQGNQGGDPSGLIVRRVPDLMQCVTYEEIIDPDEFAEMIFALYKLYNQAFTGIEVNDKGGYHVVNLLKKLGVRNQYVREVMDSTDYKKKIKKFGWFSSNTTKPTMVSDARAVIKDQSITFQDIDVVKQYMKYQELPNTHMKAIDGKDHLCDADMIAIQMSKYVHHGNYTAQSGIQKGTFAWWENLLDKNNFDVIGQTPRGPNVNHY